MKQNKPFHLFGAVIATGLLSFSGVLIETAMNVTFPSLIKEFGVSTVDIQWVTTIYLLMISIIVPLSSYLNRNFSARTLFITANLFFSLGILINCYSPTFFLLLLGRFLQGIGTGIGLPLMFHIILTKAPIETRGMMMGLGTFTTSIAPAVGPTYGGLLSNSLNWRYIYIILIPFLVASLILGIYSIPKEPRKEKQPIHFPGVFFLAVTFTFFIMALSAGSAVTFGLFLAVGIVGGLLFLRSNQHSTLLQLSVLKNRQFSLLLFSLLVYQALLLGLSFVLPNYLQIAAGFNASVAGMFMFPGALAGALLAPVSGRLLDKVGANKPILAGLFTAFLGVVLLALLLHTNSIALLIGSHLVLMIGLGFSYSNLMTSSLNLLTKDQLSDGNAIVNTLQQFVGAVSTASVAAVFSFFQQKDGFEHGTASGATAVLFIFFFLLVASIFCAFVTLHKKRVAINATDKPLLDVHK